MAHHRRIYISSCLKWTMFIFNFTFWVCGLLIIAVGSYGMYFTAVDQQDKKSLEVLYIIFTDLSGVFVAFGGTMFLISSAGCVGALRENICLLKLYFWFLTILLIFELCIAVACVVFPWKSREIVESILSRKLIEEYRDTDNTKDMVDFLQSKMECCGMTGEGYLDWTHNDYFNCTDLSPSVEKCGVPPSCCINYDVHRNMMCGYDIQKQKVSEVGSKIHTRGCVVAIIRWLENNLYIAAGVIFGITLFQMYVTHQARSLIDQISLQKESWYRSSSS